MKPSHVFRQPVTAGIFTASAVTTVPSQATRPQATARASLSHFDSVPSVDPMAWSLMLRKPALPTASHAFSSLLQRSMLPAQPSCRRRQVYASPVVCGRRSAKIATRKVTLLIYSLRSAARRLQLFHDHACASLLRTPPITSVVRMCAQNKTDGARAKLYGKFGK